MSMLILPGAEYSIGPHGYPARGEIFRFSGSDLVGLTRNGAPEYITTRWGRALKTHNSNNYTALVNFGEGGGEDRYSTVFYFAFVPLSNSSRDIFIRPGSENSWHFENNAGTLRLYSGSAYRTLRSLTVGDRYDCVLRFIAPTNAVGVWVNGVLLDSFSGYQLGLNTACIGNGYPGVSTGDTAILAASVRQGLRISDAEAAASSSDWSLSLPARDDYLFFDSAGGAGGLTLTGLTMSNFTSSGARATLGITR